MAILVINAGSSSLKVAIIDPVTGKRLLTALAERLGSTEATLRIDGGDTQQLIDASAAGALAQLIPRLSGSNLALIGVGHRVVHGGEQFTDATIIDDAVCRAIENVARLAPLHNPANLAVILATRQLFPHLPHVAVFDTAFHQTMPPAAWRYAVPESWYLEHGVRRYGFHGTSHRYVAMRAAEILGRPLADLALITAHLGNGCSATAILGGRSVDTTMGMTPLAGLVMGTRCGDLDPGIIAHLTEVTGQSVTAITKALNGASGLLGLSGLSNDMRTITTEAAKGHQGAELALTVFCYCLAKNIAALMVALGRLDALVFTGGIGEHSAVVRSRTLKHLAFLGLSEDPVNNAQHGDHRGQITASGSTIAMVVPTDEELLIARDTNRLVG